MKHRTLGLFFALGLMLGSVPANAQANVSIWVGNGPVVGGIQYQSYGGYNYYPAPVPGGFQVIYSPQYRAYGWWDARHFWHPWAGPHFWERGANMNWHDPYRGQGHYHGDDHHGEDHHY